MSLHLYFSRSEGETRQTVRGYSSGLQGKQLEGSIRKTSNSPAQCQLRCVFAVKWQRTFA